MILLLLVILGLLLWHLAVALGTEPPQVAEAASHCPHCQKQLDKAWLTCPYCHARIQHECPACGSRKRIDQNYCPVCGQAEKPGNL